VNGVADGLEVPLADADVDEFAAEYVPELKSEVYSAARVVGQSGVTAQEGAEAKAEYKKFLSNMKTRHRMYAKRAELMYMKCQQHTNRMKILNTCAAKYFKLFQSQSCGLLGKARERAMMNLPKVEVELDRTVSNAVADSGRAAAGQVNADAGGNGEAASKGPIIAKLYPGDARDVGQNPNRPPRVVFRICPDSTPFGSIKHLNTVVTMYRSGNSSAGPGPDEEPRPIGSPFSETLPLEPEQLQKAAP